MHVRLALLGALAALVVGACGAGNAPATATATPGQTDSPTGAPAATTAPTNAPTATAPPTVAPTTAVAPPPPTAVKVTEKDSNASSADRVKVTITVSWKHPAPKGVTIRVYGVTACMPPGGNYDRPCLVKGTQVPADVRDLLAEAPASRGSVSWTWPNWEVDVGVAIHKGTTYYSYVVAAYTATGHSKFIIAKTSKYCPTCTY